MLECLLGGDSFRWIASEHFVKQVQSQLIYLDEIFKILRRIYDLLSLRIKRQLLKSRPIVLIRSASNLENLL
jgi:hypothetical protein